MTMSNTAKNHTAANYAALQRRQNEAARTLDAKRKQFIRAIKTKQRQLGMDDATYRAMLLARTGKASSTLCSLTELGNVSGYLTAQGAVAPKRDARAGMPPTAKRPVVAPERQALRAKVSVLLAELARHAGIADTEAYANAICRKNGWCSALDFADAFILHKLVGALSRSLSAALAKRPA